MQTEASTHSRMADTEAADEAGVLLCASDEAGRRWLKARSRPGKDVSCWCDPETGVRDVNELFAWVAAWREVDPQRALDILREALSLQGPQGELYARYDVQGAPLTQAAVWPMLAQATEVLAERLEDTTVLGGLLPALTRTTEWLLQTMDARHTGLFKWRKRDEPPLPMDSQRLSPLAGALLLAEVEALERLDNKLFPGDRTLGHLLPEAESLADDLVTFFSGEPGQALTARAENEQHHPLPVLHLPPLLRCASLPQHVKVAVTASLPDVARQLAQKELPAGVTALWVDTLAHCSPELHRRELLVSLCETLPATPASLAQASTHLILAHTRAPQMAAPALSTLTCWMEERLALVFGVPLILLVVVVAGLALMTSSRDLLTEDDAKAQMGLGQRMLQDGQTEEALGVFRELENRTHGALAARMGRVKALMQKENYAEAETILREIVDQENHHPLMEINLSIVLLRRGKVTEAVQYLTSFGEDYEEHFPNETDRARYLIWLAEQGHFEQH